MIRVPEFNPKSNECKKDLILSISFCFHDSCITISDREKILLHLEAERLFRKKHMRFNNLVETDIAIKAALDYLDITIENISEVLITKWNNLYDLSKEVTILGKKFNPIITNHHENHIGTCFPSKFNECVILCSDGGSENGTTKLYYKKGNEVAFIEDLDDRPFTGKFYGTITQMVIEPKCSKAHNFSAGKLMGLSSCGKYSQETYDLLCENWQEINKLHFNGCEHLLEIFKLSNDYSKPWLDERRKDIAYTAHNFWVDKCFEYLKNHASFSKNICLVGGCALNISLNSKLIDEEIYENVYVSPISTDAGQSLGAILYRYPNIKCEYPYLGRGESYTSNYDEDELLKDLLSGKIIAWFQGRSEIGARALGHRSFIGLPISTKMRDNISIKIKKREPYRPVAAIVPEEFVSEYFEQNYSSVYMTFCSKAKQNTIEMAPAIVHFDGTTRIQTLRKKDNPILHSALLKLKELIGIPILMNTSFNVDGEPIVDTSNDAIKSFLKSGADELYINGNKYNKDTPLISLVIPTYNKIEVLEKLLESLNKVKILDRNDIEVIVVNNHPLEEYYDKTKQLESIYKIKCFHEKREGKAAALNFGINKANGKYIAFTDDDVEITDPLWLDKLYKHFSDNKKLGYVSGKVTMNNNYANEYSNMWEKKGGLSKGEKEKYWSREFLSNKKYLIFPWTFHQICAGANCMIPRKLLLEVGGYATFLGTKKNVDGLTLEIGYKIAKNNFELLYDPSAEIFHMHPQTLEDVKKKLFYYGKQDTGCAMYIFLKHKDYRYLWWAICGHSLYTCTKMIKSIFGKYSLSVNHIAYGLAGNLIGWIICLKNYLKSGGKENV